MSSVCTKCSKGQGEYNVLNKDSKNNNMFSYYSRVLYLLCMQFMFNIIVNINDNNYSKFLV